MARRSKRAAGGVPKDDALPDPKLPAAPAREKRNAMRGQSRNTSATATQTTGRDDLEEEDEPIHPVTAPLPDAADEAEDRAPAEPSADADGEPTAQTPGQRPAARGSGGSLSEGREPRSSRKSRDAQHDFATKAHGMRSSKSQLSPAPAAQCDRQQRTCDYWVECVQFVRVSAEIERGSSTLTALLAP